MKSANPEEFNGILQDIPLDDEHAHILVEYSHDVISLQTLIKTIEMNGTRILNSFPLRESKRNKSILFKLDIQDVREVILDLSNLSLIKLKGCNSKPKISKRGENR
jgi:hypothetical protein